MAPLVGSLPVRITCICYISYHDTEIHSMVPGFHITVSGFHFMVTGFHIMVSGFHFMVTGFHIMVSGFRIMGSGFRIMSFILCLMYNRSITIYFGT